MKLADIIRNECSIGMRRHGVLKESLVSDIHNVKSRKAWNIQRGNVRSSAMYEQLFHRLKRTCTTIVFAVCMLLLLFRPTSVAKVFAADTNNPVPIMAYYYIWFNPQSWNRAKTDLPLLGRYSSDDRSVMEQHIQWAKEAGITGFIVSWKSTLILDRRLQMLIDLAEEANFKLWIIYQGLDFDRRPLSVEQIDADLDYFIQTYSSSPVFTSYDRPVVILSGTWEFTPDQVNAITSHYRSQLYLLASEHSEAGYLRLANSVDGNAYYWSSVNPSTFPNYQEKLNHMAQAIHDHGHLWIAPAAPGFDARLIGGTSVVERDSGETLRTELDAAIRSSPDAIGLISWNEFSENTHIEPSQRFGSQYLDILADREMTHPPQIMDFDSNAQGAVDLGGYYSVIVLGLAVVFVGGSIGIVILRHQGERRRIGTSERKRKSEEPFESNRLVRPSGPHESRLR